MGPASERVKGLLGNEVPHEAAEEEEVAAMARGDG